MNELEEKLELPAPTRVWLPLEEAAVYYQVSVNTLKSTLERLEYTPNRAFGKNSPRVDIEEVNRRLRSWQT